MKFKKGDIVVEIKNELTVEEEVGSVVHCRMANHQPVQFEADKLVLVSGTFLEEVVGESKKAEHGVAAIFHKAPPEPAVLPASDI